MRPDRREDYLRALGIESWALRRGAPAARPEVPGVSEPAPGEGLPGEAVAVAAPVTRATAAGLGWTELRAAVRECRECRLCETRTQTVFGVGPENAPLMVVGEGPGADEDAKGEPFVGRAGKLLDEMLRAIGRSRTTNTFVANVVKCRPPGNREPSEDEAEACRVYLEQQLRLVKPKLIVALGRVAAQRLLVTTAPLSKLRGALHTWGSEGTPLMVTYHPAYLLRSPAEKARSWEDLKRIHRFLKDAA